MSDPMVGEPHELGGEYVLGTLPAELRRQVEQALPRDAALRAAVRDWEQRLLPLTGLVEPEVPSPHVWARIERSLPAKRVTPHDVGVAGWWERLGLWRALAAGGFAAAAALARVVGVRMQQPAPPRYMVVLAAPQDMAPGWVMQMDAAGKLRLSPLGKTVVPGQKSLQLWTKADGWKGPVSLGLVTPGQPFDVSMANLPPLQPNQLFEITLEPEQGSPIGRPTGPILYIGRAVKMI
jgi:anti-sigma-K factor RskA